MGEQRRYFPDWTRRSLASRPELEADHNSYLAGGYAEEFGYRALPGCSRGVPLLDGEPPERCRDWRSQARSMHPGYPLKAHPIAREFHRVPHDRDLRAEPGPLPNSDRLAAERAERHGTYIVVSNRKHERKLRRAAILSVRVAAAFVSVRRALRRRSGDRRHWY